MAKYIPTVGEQPRRGFEGEPIHIDVEAAYALAQSTPEKDKALDEQDRKNHRVDVATLKTKIGPGGANWPPY
jgi:hypothetical protein